MARVAKSAAGNLAKKLVMNTFKTTTAVTVSKKSYSVHKKRLNEAVTALKTIHGDKNVEIGTEDPENPGHHFVAVKNVHSENANSEKAHSGNAHSENATPTKPHVNRRVEKAIKKFKGMPGVKQIVHALGPTPGTDDWYMRKFYTDLTKGPKLNYVIQKHWDEKPDFNKSKPLEPQLSAKERKALKERPRLQFDDLLRYTKRTHQFDNGGTSSLVQKKYDTMSHEDKKKAEEKYRTMNEKECYAWLDEQYEMYLKNPDAEEFAGVKPALGRTKIQKSDFLSWLMYRRLLEKGQARTNTLPVALAFAQLLGIYNEREINALLKKLNTSVASAKPQTKSKFTFNLVFV